MRNLLLNKSSLISVVTAHKWLETPCIDLETLEDIRRLICDSSLQLWNSVSYLVNIFGPICDSIRMMEDNKATLGDAYWTIKNIEKRIEKVSAISYNEFLLDEGNTTRAADECHMYVEVQAQALRIWQERKEAGWHNALMAAALLDPKHHSKYIGLEEVNAALPVITGLLDDEADKVKVLVQSYYFRHDPKKLDMIEEYFAEELVQNGVEWWGRYGEACPELQEVGKKLLAIPPTCAASERSRWHVWEHICSDDLHYAEKDDHVKILAYINYNLRSLKVLKDKEDLDEDDCAAFGDISDTDDKGGDDGNFDVDNLGD